MTEKRILVLGATGRSGQAVLEVLSADSSITLIAALRKAEDADRLPRFNTQIEMRVIDLDQVSSLEKSLSDMDVIVQAVRLRGEIEEDALIDLDQKLRQAGNGEVKIVYVGGAGSLKMADGSFFARQPSFPRQTLPRGIAHEKLRQYLESLPNQTSWAYLIPPAAYIDGGEATGFYRKYLPSDNEEFFLSKRISYADFGHAVADAIVEDWTGVHLIGN